MSTRVRIENGNFVRTLPPRELLAEISLGMDKPARAAQPSAGRRRTRRSLRGPGAVGLTVTAMVLGAMFASTAFAVVVVDSGSVDVQVTNTGECASDSTNEGALVDYIGVDCEDLGSAGTGTFESFVRLHAGGTEQGYNTDAQKFEFDEIGGNFTHSILVSDIPVVTDPDHPGVFYWELFADVNESNSASDDAALVSLNDVEVYFTDDPAITGYPFGGTADPIYDYADAILIRDVNAGSGEADLRYRIPLTDITISPECGYKDPACETYFVLYTRWGTTEDYETDGGFEEWKVKTYPFVTVSKTAATTFTRTFAWTIDKSVTPATWDLFTGDTGTSEYTVAVTKDAGTDSAWAVSGTITIDNPGTLDAEIASVSDVISGVPTVATVDCGVTFPYTLVDGGTLECTYSTPLPDGSAQTNTATATLVDGPAFTGDADVTFGSPTTVVNDSINVTDTNGGAWQFSDDGSVSYTATFACDDDEGTHNNTATITETGQNDSASVTVTCNALEVTKDASTGFTRTYHWIIDKSSDDPNGHALTLNPGETYVDYPYDVTVDLDDPPFTDSASGVSGNIHVHNPASIAATLTGVADVISGVPTTAVVDCGVGVTFPHVLAAGATLDCTYSAALPDTSAQTNTATATLQNHDYDKDLVATDSGTTDFSGTAAVDFTSATITEIDECIDVTDTFAGALGTACFGETLPKTFSYDRTFGPFTTDDCGTITIDNTASFVANDTGATDNSSWQVVITIPCPEGCTLTQGYWKTHSSYGPAPEDPNWLLLGALGPDTPFFTSGQTWYQVFWTPPTKGNAYYILAHQYMAAKLNILSGADSTTAVDAAITFAETFFGSHSPTDILTKPVRTEVITNAGILGSYNQGLIGPGHCSEDSIALAGAAIASAGSSPTLQAFAPIAFLPLGLPVFFALRRRRQI